MSYYDKRIKEVDNILFVVTGGIGRNISATAVVKNLKLSYPDKNIIVISGCPDLFIKNPNVYKSFNLNSPQYIYTDYIQKGNSVLLNVEPYQSYDYITRKKHFVECWCDMLEISCDTIYPELFLSESERRMAELFLQKYTKDVVLFQHCGGKTPEKKGESEEIMSRSGMYKRDLPNKVADEVAEGLVERGFIVGAVQHPNQHLLPKAELISFPIRAILALIPHVKGIIATDSFLQHGTAIFKKQALILWGGTNPKVLGYDFNNNLTREVCDNPMCHRPNSYLFDLESTNFQWDCPWGDRCMSYESKYILEEFDKMTGGVNERRNTEDRTACKCEGTCKTIHKDEVRVEEKTVESVSIGNGESVPASLGAVGID